jgi:pimeloyl-ACP methyl ester carboxylesterase
VTSRLVAGACAVAVVATACGGKADSRAEHDAANRGMTVPKPKKVVGLPGSIVDVGGHFLYFDCVGKGSPTVVLEAGFGGDARDWRTVQPQLGATTRTCSDDRAGINGSSAIPGVHDANDEIRDLRVLLDRAEIAGPYVLVGHSYGGLLVQILAAKHRDEVVGVVLVDSSHPDQQRRFAQALPREPSFAGIRRDLALPVVSNGVAVLRSFALARRVRTLGDTPLVVLTAGEDTPGDTLPPRVRGIFARTRLALQEDLASLSTDHLHAIALFSDHFIHAVVGQPDVVVRAVRTVVHAARSRSTLPPCKRVFRGLGGVRCR